MAVLGDVSTIRTLIEPFTTVIPCVVPYENNKMILSESKHLAVIYDLNTCLPIKCWTFSEFDPLVAPFIYDSQREKFVAVKKNKVALFKCDSEEECLQVKLGHQVHCVIDNPKNEALILFKNGFTRKISLVIQEKGRYSGKGAIPDQESIEKVVITRFDDDQAWLLVSTSSSDNPFRNLYLIKVDLVEGSSSLESKFNLKKTYATVTVMKDGQPIGLTEKGDLFILNEDGEQLLTSLNNCTIIGSLCLPEDNTLAIVVKEDNCYQLQIINLKYLVKTCHVTLDLVPLKDYICHANGNLFIGCTKGMLSIPYEIKPASLASVMGRNTAKTSNGQADNHHIFLDSTTDIKIIPPSNEDINLDELEKLLPKADELLSEKAIFSALRTILTSKCFSLEDVRCNKLIASIISRPFNHNFMVSVMKEANLTTEQFVQVLDILTNMMDVGRSYIVDWVTVTMDAHFKLILFSKSELVKNALKRVEKSIDEISSSLEQIRECNHLIENLLTSERGILNGNKYNDEIRNVNYCIEVLEL